MTHLNDPLSVVRAAIDVLNREDWSSAAALVDPISLRVFINNLRERLAPATPPRTVTAEEYMATDPQLPREVAEYHAAEARRFANPTTRLKQEFPGVDSVDVLRALPPEELFARWLDGRSAGRQIEHLAAEGRISKRVAELRLTADFAMYQYVVIGVVLDGPHLAHVLYRHDVDPSQPWRGDLANWLASQPADEQELTRELWARGHPSMATVRRQSDGSWRLIVEHDFLNISSLHISDVRIDERQESDSDAPAT